MSNIKWAAIQARPSGTISGRVVESLLLTLPSRVKGNPNKGYEQEKIAFGAKTSFGFENEKHVLVSFDFNGQELGIAAMLAQSFLAENGGGSYSGSDTLDFAVLSGDKAKGTDVHSITGGAAGVSRMCGKGLVYALLYGSGLKTAAKVIASELPPNEKHLAIDRAKKALKALKGDRNWDTGQYYDGVASNYFNRAYSRSAKGNVKLDLFNQAIPKSLDSAYTQKSGSPAQINFSIQSLASTNGLLSAYSILLKKEIELAGLKEARQIASIHDEIVCMCKVDETETMAKCMIRAHCGAWALLSNRLGISDLPVQRLLYDIKVSVSKVLRKEPNQIINTPDLKYDKMGYEYLINQETGELDIEYF
ncbi:MAG: hypothetical protein ACRDBG_08260 [Waterburya sp.]